MSGRLRNLQDVQSLVTARRQELAQHDFLRLLEQPGGRAALERMVPRMAFFVMCFQDVTRLAFERSTDPELKEMAREHWLEDQGHDVWYLQDLEQLGIHIDIPWLFGSEHRLTREVAYSQIAQVTGAVHDSTRVAIVLALEAIGAEFFHRAIAHIERLGLGVGLKYFADSHKLIESDHQIFEPEAQARLSSLRIPESSEPEVRQAVDAIFESMTRLAGDLALSLKS
jgi:hypothetical protein